MKIFHILNKLWIVSAILILGLYFYGEKVLLRTENDSKLMTHQALSEKEAEKNLNEKNRSATFDPSKVKAISPDEYAKANLKYEKLVQKYGVGSLYIPSSQIRTKILAGMSNENMSIAVGTYYSDQVLGKKNYVVLAHNLVEGGGVLNNLPATPLNSIIYATDFSKIFEYVVKKNEYVNDYDGHYLDHPAPDKEPVITLFRCVGGLGSIKRALVQGVYVKDYPVDEASDELKENLGLVERKAETKTPVINNTKENKELSKTGFTIENPKYTHFERLCIKVHELLSSPIGMLIFGVIFVGIFALFILLNKKTA